MNTLLQLILLVVLLFLYGGVVLANRKWAHGNGQPSIRLISKWNDFMGLGLLIEAVRSAKKEKLLRFFLKVVQRTGDTFAQNLFFHSAIVTNEPANIEAILKGTFKEFCFGLRPWIFNPLLGDGIFTQDDEHWRASRKLLTRHLFHAESKTVTLKNAVSKLISDIPEDREVDFQPLAFRLTLRTTLSLLFGEALGTSMTEQLCAQELEFADAFNTAQDYLAWRSRLGHFYWLLSGSKFRDACKVCHNFIGNCIRIYMDQNPQRSPISESSHESPSPFIEALLRKTKSPVEQRDQCLNILLAGRDTTACCMTWALRLLVLHPVTLSILRTEINEAFKSSFLENDISQVTKLNYLDKVVKEVLRLYPSVPVNSRSANQDAILPTGGGSDGKGPLQVLKGTPVVYCAYTLHRRPDFYGKDAEFFRPECWDDGMTDYENNFKYVPFNRGPRECLGREFALLEV